MPPAIRASAPRSPPNGKAPQAHRKTAFQNLRIRHFRIGHMSLHRITAVKSRPSARAASNGFIILKLRIAPDKIIHSALAASHNAQRPNEGVAGRLTDFCIARNHRSRIGRVEHRIFWHDNIQRLETALI